MEAQTIDQSLTDRVEALQRSQQPAPAPGVAPQIRGYNLTERLGAGTFGEVWAGTSQRTCLEVALKVFTRTNSLDWSYLCQEVARLGKVAEHPHVVTLLDADLEHNPPFFAMRRYCSSLHEWRHNQEKPDIQRILTWWHQMAQALQYTHSKGLLHCDIKPSNLLLDAEGRAYLSDFGQAAAGRGGGGSHFGSLGYMAPEQASQLEEGSSSPDVLWDIYALGASIYYMLSKKLPRISDEALNSLGSVAETAEKLSRYRKELTERPLVPIRSYCPALGGEFAALLESCLDLDPRKRPQSAADLLADFERIKEKRPLLCRQPWSPAYRGERFVRRNMAPLLVAAVFFGGTGFTAGHHWTEQRELQARGDFDRGVAAVHDGRTLAAAQWWTRSLSVQPNQEAPRWLLREDPAHLEFYKSMGQPLNQVGFSPDGNLVYASGENGTQIFDLRTGEPRGTRLGAGEARPENPIRPMYRDYPSASVVLGDGQILTLTNKTEIWSLQNPGEKKREVPGGPALQAAASRDGKHLLLLRKDGVYKDDQKLPSTGSVPRRMAISGDGEQVAVGDEAGNLWLMSPKPHLFHKFEQPVDVLAVSPDGRWLAASTETSKLLLWDLHGRASEPRQLEHGSWAIFGMTFCPQSKRLAYSCYDGQTYLLDLEGGVPPRIFKHRWLSYNTTFSPDGRFLATHSMDGTARVWNARTGRPVSPFLEHSSPVKSVSFRPGPSLQDAVDLATACEDGTVRVFRIDLKNQPIPMPSAGRAHQAAYSPDGKLLAIACEDPGEQNGWVEVWDGQKFLDELPSVPGGFQFLSWHPSGKHFAVGGKKSDVYVFTPDGRQLHQLPGHGLRWLEYSSKGQLVVCSADGKARVYEGEKQLAELAPQTGGELAAARFSPDGSTLATSCGKNVDLWETAGFQKLRSLEGHLDNVRMVAFSPDGKTLASTSLDKTARLWNVADGSPSAVPIHHELAVNDVVFSPDGKTLATAAADGTAGLWNARTAQAVSPVLSHRGPVWNIRYSPDGKMLSTCTKVGVANLWGANGQMMASPIEHGDYVYTACFRPDGKQLATVSWDGTIQLRDLSPPPALGVAQLQREVEKRTGLRVKIKLGSCMLRPLKPEEWSQL